MSTVARFVYYSGYIVLIAGFGMLAALFCQRYLDLQPLHIFKASTDSVFETDALQLDAERAHLRVELTFDTHTLGEEFSRDGVIGELPLFRLPVNYEVSGRDGEIVLSQTRLIDAVGNRIVRPQTRQSELPKRRTRYVDSDPFDVDGPLRVALAVYPDTTFDAKPIDARLLLYKVPAPIAQDLAKAALIVAGGVFVLLLGLSMEVLSTLRGGRAGKSRRVEPHISDPSLP